LLYVFQSNLRTSSYVQQHLSYGFPPLFSVVATLIEKPEDQVRAGPCLEIVRVAWNVVGGQRLEERPGIVERRARPQPVTLEDNEAILSEQRAM
jgi:hypothetical protein